MQSTAIEQGHLMICEQGPRALEKVDRMLSYQFDYSHYSLGVLDLRVRYFRFRSWKGFTR